MNPDKSFPEVQFAAGLELLHLLKRQAVRDNKRENLDLLWQVLKEMWLEGERNFGLADVGSRLTEVGGPKTQSLRNEGGKDFRELINSFTVCSGSHRPSPTVRAHTSVELAVEALPDPALKAIFRQMLAENKLYKTQNDQLKSSFKNLSVKVPDKIDVPNSPTNELLLSQPPLSSVEKELLRRSLCPERLEENGWRATEAGVVDDSGLLVLPCGFMDIITRLIAS